MFSLLKLRNQGYLQEYICANYNHFTEHIFCFYFCWFYLFDCPTKANALKSGYLMWHQGFVGGNCWAFIAKKNSATLFHFHPIFAKYKTKSILVILVGRLFQAENSFISNISARFVFIDYLVPKLFPLQVFLLPEIILIAEIIIIATRCLIRWEWQNFHRPYSRKNFPRLSSHKKRHKLTPHILLKTKIYEYSRMNRGTHNIHL